MSPMIKSEPTRSDRECVLNMGQVLRIPASLANCKISGPGITPIFKPGKRLRFLLVTHAAGYIISRNHYENDITFPPSFTHHSPHVSQERRHLNRWGSFAFAACPCADQQKQQVANFPGWRGRHRQPATEWPEGTSLRRVGRLLRRRQA